MRTRPFLWCARQGALLWVKVPPRADHSERSEAQLHEGNRVWKGSVERNCETMDKNRIEGAAAQGERAHNREALVVKESGVNPAVVQGRSAFLPEEISPCA